MAGAKLSEVKIGQLELTHQIWRGRADPQKGISSGPDSWIWCTRCGDVLPTDPWEPGHCECENVCMDYGRLVVDDWVEVKAIQTSSRPDLPE